MTGRRDTLERIAAALERIAPRVPEPSDWLAHPAYIWTGETARPVGRIDAVALDTLRGIDEQKAAVTANLDRLASGAAAHDMLLWGSRGMGKSALVRAGVHAIAAEKPGKLTLVQLAPGTLASVAQLIEALAGHDRAFVLFIDDLGFGEGEAQDNLALRSLLDGGLVSRPGHIRLAVTSNRRAIVARDSEENTPLQERDERDNSLALAYRFGLRLGFLPRERPSWLEMLRDFARTLGPAADV